MQWLQNPNQSNLDNLNNARQEASRYFRNRKRQYLKTKINELETNNKNKNIRELYVGINDFKKGYQPRTNTVKDAKGHLVADCHSILTRWRNYFSQLLNAQYIHVPRMRESRSEYRVLVRKPEGSRPLGGPRCRWEKNIKVDLRKVGCGHVLDRFCSR
jgi:hypothetical protein